MVLFVFKRRKQPKTDAHEETLRQNIKGEALREEALRQNIIGELLYTIPRCIFTISLGSLRSLIISIARLKAKSAATNTTEFDEWGPECAEGWNPADEARQAKRLESWQSSQAQGPKGGNHKTTCSPSFQPYQNPRQKPQQPLGDLRLRSEESNLQAC